MALHNVLGKTGEDIAIEYLQGRGYQILHRNWRRGSYEIDIVACTEEELVIIEVKTRSNNSYSDPEDAVTNRKINHIVSATDIYIKLFNIDLPVRFDIISVIGHAPPFEIDHIEDAFYPPLNTYRR
ncbi:MAG: YraN family protein [Dysgonamonadaceae bacterium]|jgi:putative endonuclease|nr:YraN family protein [Dysgonamonadaceae bacterium]